MVTSMTGFGTAGFKGEGINYTVEIKSVNHRYIDIFIKLPRRSLRLEEIIKKKIRNVFKRGYLEVFIYQDNNGQHPQDIKYNKAIIQSYLNLLRKIKGEFNLPGEVDINTIFQLKEIVAWEELQPMELEATKVEEAVDTALLLVKEMRIKEGNQIKNDILLRINTILSHLSHIKGIIPQIISEYATKLKERLDMLLKNNLKEPNEVDQQRIAQEIAIYVDRCDISEELLRIESHIKQFREILSSDDSVGRKMDFILQEMNRETNTITAKTNCYEIISHAIEIKSEIEKIREQVQNIE